MKCTLSTIVGNMHKIILARGSIIGGRTFRKPPFFVPSKPQTAFVFF